MSHFLNRTSSILILFAGTVMVASGQTVIAPAKRQASLEHAKAFVAPREIVAVNVDPFYSPAFAEAVSAMGRVSNVPTQPASTQGATEAAKTPAGPRNDKELLQAIAQSLKPGGSIVLNGQPTLLFGQKRVKAGGVLTITFEGNQYTLEVVSIDRTNFTLRLNREEFTRTIK
jgi:hypothetical protein